MLICSVRGHRIVVRPLGKGRWIGEFDPQVPVMDRPFDLRSTYEGPQPNILLMCMQVDAHNLYDPDYLVDG